MRIATSVTGDFGFMTSVCLADFGHDLIRVDVDKGKVDALESCDVVPLQIARAG